MTRTQTHWFAKGFALTAAALFGLLAADFAAAQNVEQDTDTTSRQVRQNQQDQDDDAQQNQEGATRRESGFRGTQNQQTDRDEADTRRDAQRQRDQRDQRDGDQLDRQRDQQREQQRDQIDRDDARRRETFRRDQQPGREQFGRDQQAERGPQAGRQRQGQINLGASFDTQEGDLVVQRVREQSAARQIGLREGDVILEVNGREVASEQELHAVLRQAQPGAEVELLIVRDGRQRTLFIEPQHWQLIVAGRQPGMQPGLADPYGPWWMQEDQAQFNNAGLGVILDPRFTNYAVVMHVVRGSPAEQAGIQSGDQIVALNGQRISSPLELAQLVGSMQPGDQVDIRVARRQLDTLQARLGSRREALNPGQEQFRTGRFDRDEFDDRGFDGRGEVREERFDRTERGTQRRESARPASPDRQRSTDRFGDFD